MFKHKVLGILNMPHSNTDVNNDNNVQEETAETASLKRIVDFFLVWEAHLTNFFPHSEI